MRYYSAINTLRTQCSIMKCVGLFTVVLDKREGLAHLDGWQGDVHSGQPLRSHPQGQHQLLDTENQLSAAQRLWPVRVSSQQPSHGSDHI